MVPGRGRSRKILTFIKQFRVLAIHERQFKGSSFCRKNMFSRWFESFESFKREFLYTTLATLPWIFCDQFPRIVLDYFPCSRELFIYFLACIYLKLKFSSQDKCRVFFFYLFRIGFDSVPSSRRLRASLFVLCIFSAAFPSRLYSDECGVKREKRQWQQ